MIISVREKRKLKKSLDKCAAKCYINNMNTLTTMKISTIKWAYEDDLPEMAQSEFDAIYAASRVDIVRQYPYVEDDQGNRIWITK